MSTAPQSPQQPEAAPQPEAAQPEAQQPAAQPEVSSTRSEVRVRRAPKYSVFIFGGIALGVIVTLIAVAVAPGDDQTPFTQVFGYFVLYGIAAGALVGAIVAVIFDAILGRRARAAETDHTVARSPESGDEVDGKLD